MKVKVSKKVGHLRSLNRKRWKLHFRGFGL